MLGSIILFFKFVSRINYELAAEGILNVREANYERPLLPREIFIGLYILINNCKQLEYCSEVCALPALNEKNSVNASYMNSNNLTLLVQA